jgi:predicted dehydrogenase
MQRAIRVAIAGVSGIGKHHAKWHHLAGADVVAFWGSSADSCARATETLQQIFPFSGRGYWDLDELLQAENPDVFDICLPNELHYSCAVRALEHGCHVLCEKPLIWSPDCAVVTMLEQGQTLLDSARERGRRLGVCTQYAACLPHYARLYELQRGSLGKINSFYAEMETLSRGRRRDAEEIWIDMGPHPLSLLLAWMPAGMVVGGSMEVIFSGGEARIGFEFTDAENTCRCDISVRDLGEGKPVRRFGVNDFIVGCEGRADDMGAYRCVLNHREQEEMGDDFMALLISQFLHCANHPEEVLLASGEAGLRNLELQLQILQSV